MFAAALQCAPAVVACSSPSAAVLIESNAHGVCKKRMANRVLSINVTSRCLPLMHSQLVDFVQQLQPLLTCVLQTLVIRSQT